MPGVELRIVDDAAERSPDGAVGRVLLRSGAAMLGYWGVARVAGRRSAELLDERPPPRCWVADGLDEHRRLRAAHRGRQLAAGRAGHERYIRGGYNVYPAEARRCWPRIPRGQSGRDRGAPTMSWASGRRRGRAQAGTRARTGRSASPLCRALSDYKSPDALVVVDDSP